MMRKEIGWGGLGLLVFFFWPPRGFF